MGVIKVKDSKGQTDVLEAVPGWRVMDLVRDHGLSIEAQCGGACARATCHVHVAPRLGADDEEAALDSLPAVAQTSRLSCQIIWDDHLDGLELTLPGA